MARVQVCSRAMANFFGPILKVLGFVQKPGTTSSGYISRDGSGPRELSVSNRELPDAVTFHFPASERLIGLGAGAELLKAIKAFAPSQPVLELSQFAGRAYLLEQLVAAIEEHRNHIVIFGGRGTGKTSLAMALMTIAREVGYHCAYVSCGRESTIDSIGRSALANLPIRFDERFDPRSENADPGGSFIDLMPEEPISAQHLLNILARIHGTRVLLVIDEFDRSESLTLSRDLTELMKVLSDRAIPLQIVIVGVGNVVDTFISQHASIARILYMVRVEAMTASELEETLALSAEHAGVVLRPQVVSDIVELAHGRPYIARLVGLKATKMALERGSQVVEVQDLRRGTSDLSAYLDASGFGSVRELITRNAGSTLLFDAMLRCKRDAADQFTLADVIEILQSQSSTGEMSTIVQRAVDLLASNEFGFLAVVQGSVTRYRFVDPRAELSLAILCSAERHDNKDNTESSDNQMLSQL